MCVCFGDQTRFSAEPQSNMTLVTTGSQTDEESSNNMAEATAEINRKLDLALAQVQEI